MNAIGIDVSKDKSTVIVMQISEDEEKVIVKPYDVLHTVSELGKLAEFLRSLNGETRVFMEDTGVYSQPIANYLHGAGMRVYTVNPKKVRGYGEDDLRKVKNDKADAKKIAEYGYAKRLKLREYTPQDEVRKQMKSYSRQYELYSKVKTMLKNNLTALLEQVFPGIIGIFTSSVKDDGHQKWIDFANEFWHIECVRSILQEEFSVKYHEWCGKFGYKFSKSKAAEIYAISQEYIAVMPMNEITRTLLKTAVRELNATSENQAEILRKLKEIAQSMPEYQVVIEMSGVGENIAAQLIAEIGDVLRFEDKNALSGFGGIDSPQDQSGTRDTRGKSVTKNGSANLRRILFLVMSALLQSKPDDKIYNFLDKKRREGKLYRVYMVAGMNKFLKIYYARVKEHLEQINAQKS